MLNVPEASSRPGFWLSLSALEAERPRMLAETVRLAEIASPTGSEGSRAEAVRELLEEALGEAKLDATGNVLARLPGRPGGRGTALLAPLDAPYPPGTRPVIDVRPDRLTGQGVTTHAVALSALVALARTLRAHPVAGLGDIHFIATVGSEMAGDLRGICNLFPWLPTEVDRVLCLQGPGLGRLDHWSVGTYRGELNIYTPGGHCWRDAGRPSALRLAMEFSSRMETLPRPGFPRTLYNPARLESGEAWNMLPSRALLWFEFRSDAEDELQRLIREAQKTAGELARDLPGCQVRLTQRGFRHATGLFPEHPLVTGLREAQAWAGLVSRLGASSSDASVCLHYGVAAATIGLVDAVGQQTLMETALLSGLESGLRQAFMATIQLAGGAR